MQLGSTLPAQNSKIGTCPHGLPIGACPICNGSGGGGVSRRDVPRNPGEMTYNQCAAIGAMMKANKMAKLSREEANLQHIKTLEEFQKAMDNAIKKNIQFASFFNNSFPAIIAKPLNFLFNSVLNGTINFIKNLPSNITALVQHIGQKIADISDKLTVIIGEIKAAIDKTVSDLFKSFKKKVKSLFSIFSPQDVDDEEKQLEETKRTFELKTFIHDLYKKLTQENKKDIENGEC